MDGKVTLKVSGMTCGHCTARVEKALMALPGVTNTKAELESGLVTIEADAPLDRAAIRTAVEEAGYEVID